MPSKVRVIARVRPVDESQDVRVINNAIQLQDKQFEFDKVFGEDASQDYLYEASGTQRCIDELFLGIHGTVMAYGQTGSGKTYSMNGIIPRAVVELFDHPLSVDTQLSVSYLEVYNEKLVDLLVEESEEELKIREHPDGRVFVQGLTSHTVLNADELSEYLALGLQRRKMGATQRNATSSRSHSLILIHSHRNTSAATLTLVDLAGSERQGQQASSGERFSEGIHINQSLLSLKQVITALSVNTKPPYRNSKLTRLLSNALGGSAQTILLACINPEYPNECLNTLRYACSARRIQNVVRPNLHEKEAAPKPIEPHEHQLLQRENEALQTQVRELLAQVEAHEDRNEEKSKPNDIDEASKDDDDAPQNDAAYNELEKALEQTVQELQELQDKLDEALEIRKQADAQTEGAQRQLRAEMERRRKLEDDIEQLKKEQAKLEAGFEMPPTMTQTTAESSEDDEAFGQDDDGVDDRSNYSDRSRESRDSMSRRSYSDRSYTRRSLVDDTISRTQSHYETVIQITKVSLQERWELYRTTLIVVGIVVSIDAPWMRTIIYRFLYIYMLGTQGALAGQIGLHAVDRLLLTDGTLFLTRPTTATAQASPKKKKLVVKKASVPPPKSTIQQEHPLHHDSSSSSEEPSVSSFDPQDDDDEEIDQRYMDSSDNYDEPMEPGVVKNNLYGPIHTEEEAQAAAEYYGYE